jgi:cellulose biosynthesis protein BcsQ
MNFVFRTVIAMTIALTSVSIVGMAQDVATPSQGRAAERVEQFKKLRMMEVMNLDEQTSIKFFARYNRNQEVMKALRQKQVQALARIQELRKGKASDSEFGSIITELRALDEQVSQTRSKYVEELSEVLTNRQLAEYLVFELRFQQNLRDLVRDVQRNK